MSLPCGEHKLKALYLFAPAWILRNLPLDNATFWINLSHVLDIIASSNIYDHAVSNCCITMWAFFFSSVSSVGVKAAKGSFAMAQSKG